MVDVVIQILPVGILLGLGVVLFLRFVKYVWRRLSESPSSISAHAGGLVETVANVVKSVMSHNSVLLIDVVLFLYLFFHYEWASVFEPMKGLPNLWLFLFMPHVAVIVLVQQFGPFVLATSFFVLLAGCLLMSRFYVGSWPMAFRLSCMMIFIVALAWLTFQWWQTGWDLARTSASVNHGLKGMLIAGLYSPCSPRVFRIDPIKMMGPSIGMSMMEGLATLYLAEKYLRLVIFHERRGELGFGWWIRFAPVVPVLLIVAFVGYGIWEDIQRNLHHAAAKRIEHVILPSNSRHLVWQMAVEQCAARGSDWRLPTQHELHLLSQNTLASDTQVSSAWSAEVHPEHGAYVWRWRERREWLSSDPTMRGRCLTSAPSDLYQRLVTSLYPALDDELRQDKLLYYFYAGEVFNTQSGIRGDLPEAVICVKSTLEADHAAAPHLTKNTTLIRDMSSASAILKNLCNNTANPSGPCQTLVTQRREEPGKNDPVWLDVDFKARQEKCRLTSDPEVCAGQGWYYRVRGEFDHALLFYDWSCQKGFGNACLDKDHIKSEQHLFTSASEKLLQLGLVSTAPLRHWEAKEPLVLGCDRGEAELCLYRGMIAEWEDKREDARGFYARGCAGGLLLACTREVLMERHFTMAKNIDRDITPKFMMLCKKKESLACMQAASSMMSDRQEGTVRQEGIQLLADACAAGVPDVCKSYQDVTRPNGVHVPDELDEKTLRTASSYDIDRLREQCSGSPNNCRGIVNQLALQGQFKEAEGFAKAACDYERRENLPYCYQMIPYRNLFQSLSQTLIEKKYVKRQPPDHASALPAMKRACEEGVVQSCSYLGMLMYDAMTGLFPGSHPQYSLAGLVRPYQNACKFGDASACKRVLDLAREWREGQYAAEKERYRRPATVEEIKAYGRLCEERNYAGACWEVLQPWLEDRKQDHRQVPDHLASAWRYTERQCEKNKDTVACWTFVKPWIDSLEHDHSKLPKDRSPIRKQLERICEIEVEEGGADKRACRELQRYIDLHWL